MWRFIVGCALFLCLFSNAALAGGKFALVIGNANYVGADRLSTPLGDASLIATRLQQLGFKVTHYDNLDRAALFADVADFAVRARSADVIAFYYAGHGFEVSGQNYLMPVDLPVPIDHMSAAALQRDGVSLAMIRGALARAGARAQVIIVDACRSPPGRGIDRHTMAAAQAANGVVLAWSTAPGSGAIDSMQALGEPIDHSPFAYYLAANLADPELGIIQVLQRTQEEVSVATGNVQRPWYSSGLVGTLRLAANNVGSKGAIVPLGRYASAQRRGAGGQTMQAAEALWTSEWRAIIGAQGSLDAERIRSLQAQAVQGNHRAQVILGRAYDQAGGCQLGYMSPSTRCEQATAYYREAAQAGYVPGETALGGIYFVGPSRDLAKADRWLQAASNAGDRIATFDYLLLRIERDAGSNPQAARGDADQLRQFLASYLNDESDDQLHAYVDLEQSQIEQLAGENPMQFIMGIVNLRQQVDRLILRPTPSGNSSSAASP